RRIPGRIFLGFALWLPESASNSKISCVFFYGSLNAGDTQESSVLKARKPKWGRSKAVATTSSGKWPNLPRRAAFRMSRSGLQQGLPTRLKLTEQAASDLKNLY